MKLFEYYYTARSIFCEKLVKNSQKTHISAL